MRSLTDTDRSRVLRAAARLLAYPDEALFAQRSLLATAATAVTPRAGHHLARFCDYLETTPLLSAQAAYVETFDLNRRCSLYLTYFTYGDTRKRGMALLRFTHAYRAAGYELMGNELPDHLAVVCEFAGGAPAEGLRLLREQRASIELLRLGLAELSSPYVDVVDAVRAVLPEPSSADLKRTLDLAQTGPPAEEVGLAAFASSADIGGRR